MCFRFLNFTDMSPSFEYMLEYMFLLHIKLSRAHFLAYVIFAQGGPIFRVLSTHHLAYQTFGKSDNIDYLGRTCPSNRHSVWEKILKNAHSLVSNMKFWKFAHQRPLGSPWVNLQLWRFGPEINFCAPLEWHQTHVDLALALVRLLGSAVLDLEDLRPTSML